MSDIEKKDISSVEKREDETVSLNERRANPE
jgi:hypothetical protein